MSAFPCRTTRGFTLVEAVVILAVLAILLVLTLRGAAAISRYQRDTVCLKNMRTVGTALLNYAQDNRGVLLSRQLRNPETNQRIYYWMEALKAKGYVRDFAPSNRQFSCPTGPPSEGRNECYGLRAWNGTLVQTDEELPIYRIEQPSAFFIIADSIGYGGARPLQWYAIQRRGHSNAVHLRHRGRAHAFFADGHVEAKEAVYFETLHETAPEFTSEPFEVR